MADMPKDLPSTVADAAPAGAKGDLADPSSPVKRAPVSVDEEARQIFWRAGLGIAVIGVMLVSLLVWLVPALDLDLNFDFEQTDAPVRVRSDAPTGYYVKRGTVMTQGVDGESVSPRDLLRFFVKTSAPKHVVILGQDDTGIVRTYFPPPETSQWVEAGRDTLLEGSVELNDTLGEETLYFFLCDAKAKLRGLRQILLFGELTEEQPGCVVDTITLNKVRRP